MVHYGKCESGVHKQEWIQGEGVGGRTHPPSTVF